jgi:predicted outer membrane repeat protein
MKLNKFAAKAVSVLIAIMLVSSQNIFANIIINEDYTTTQTEYKNYTQSGSGGVFDVSGDNATLTVQNGVNFSSNTAQGSPAYGGAIEVSNRYSKVKIGSQVGFRYNKAEYGGAIDNFGNIEIGDNVLFSSNKSSSSGGAIYNDGTYNKAGIITIGSGAAFNTNEAAYGGAIYNFRGSDITFGDRATFAGNKSKRHGGAIYNEAVLTFGSNSVFQNNGAEEDGGGAIYNTADGEMIIGTNSMFLVNKSTSTGGAIYNNGTEKRRAGAEFINK